MPVDESLSLAVCPACSTPVYRWRVGGIEYTADLSVVDAQQAASAAATGRRLYRITYTGGRPTAARPADPRTLTALVTAPPAERPAVVPAHGCKAATLSPSQAAARNGVTRPLAASQPTGGPGVRTDPPVPSAGHQTPSSGPQTEHSGARTAVKPRSDRPGPRCNRCSRPMADGTYAAIEVGDLLVWAEHLTDCTA